VPGLALVASRGWVGGGWGQVVVVCVCVWGGADRLAWLLSHSIVHDCGVVKLPWPACRVARF
jgi:hypothetical protein